MNKWNYFKFKLIYRYFFTQIVKTNVSTMYKKRKSIQNFPLTSWYSLLQRYLGLLKRCCNKGNMDQLVATDVWISVHLNNATLLFGQGIKLSMNKRQLIWQYLIWTLCPLNIYRAIISRPSVLISRSFTRYRYRLQVA